MFRTKKVIPSLAAASMALAGCGDSGGEGGAGGNAGAGGAGGDGGTGGISDEIAEVISQYCMKLVECYEGYSQQECEEVYTEDAERISDECLPLYAAYLDCLSELSCVDLYYNYDSCLEEVAEEFGQERLDACY